jgi:hypothetical protein
VCEWCVIVHAIYKLDIAKGWVWAPGVGVRAALHFSTESGKKKGVLSQQCCVLFCELLVGEAERGASRAETTPLS